MHDVDLDRFRKTGSAYDRPEGHCDPDLALVTRGTATGELLRRYWHPAFKSDKLKDLPVAVRLLGEDIVLFRKPSGEAAAVYPRCVHRGTSLFFGKVTEQGLRCAYHGWTFDTDGKCVDQPCEPNRGAGKRNAVRQPWYPVEERYGLVFVYQGPLDRKPPLPRYDLLESIPAGWELYADDTTIPSGGAGYMPCNWLQHHENGMDPHHVAIVHEHQFPPLMAQAESTYSFEKAEDRVRGRGISKIGPALMDFRVELIVPNVRVIPNPLLPEPRPDGKSDSVAWTVPKDDTDTIVFTVLVQPAGSGPLDGDAELYDGRRWRDLSPEDHQRFPGDFETQVGQGPITLHSEEHLTASDRGVVFVRRLLQEGARIVAEGGTPPLTGGEEPLLIETTASARMSANPDFTSPADDGAPSVALPAAAAPAEGAERWALTLQTPLGEQKLLLVIARAGAALTGSVTGDDGERPIRDGHVLNGRMTWKVDLTKPMTLTATFDVEIVGATLRGSVKPGIFPASPVTGARL